MKSLYTIVTLIIYLSGFAQNEYQLDTLYNPAKGKAKNVALIYFGGSEGGMASWDFAQDSLPAKGYPTLAVKYHEKRETPKMVQIPLDSIHNMIKHFKSRPEIKGKKLVLDGVSKGAELVLLLGSLFEEVDAVMALAPSHVAWEAIDFTRWQDKSTWMYQGKDVPYMPYDREAFGKNEIRADAYRASLENKDAGEAAIKVEQTKGPILLFSGEADKSWPASQMGEMIMERLKKNNFQYRYEHYSYPNANHTLGTKEASAHYYKIYNEFLEQLDFEAEFNQVSKTYQDAYMNANCDVLLTYLDENLVIFENGEHWPYTKLVEYCPNLPVKPVANTERSYKVLSENLVYEFVSQTYKNSRGETVNETQAMIWKYLDEEWKIINYDVSRYQIVD